MQVKQFYDKGLAHSSYAIESDGVIALIDPARNPEPYVAFAEQCKGRIVAVLETHPHADFASSHLEFHQKYNATIYVNPKTGVSYPHKTASDGDLIPLGKVVFKTLFTPGHSPDHNSYLLMDEQGNPHSIYTGDSLFVGDVGRPDLREGTGNMQVQREGLARMMYRTVQDVFNKMPDDVLVYPAHGAGSLCGKNLSTDTFSSIGRERAENWAFKVKSEADFVRDLLEDQPFVPKYFPYDVDINRRGLPSLTESMQAVPMLEENTVPEVGALIVDARPQAEFQSGHLAGSINIQDGEKFETWLGSIISPDEHFYLIAGDSVALKEIIAKTAKIGYERLIKGALVMTKSEGEKSPLLPLGAFKAHPENYTIVDIRNKSEHAAGAFFKGALNIPLPELRERVGEINTDKPVVVHCAGGYRSAAGASIVRSNLPESTPVYDLSESINDFK